MTEDGNYFTLEENINMDDLEFHCGQQHLTLVLSLYHRHFPFWMSHSHAPPKMMCKLLDGKDITLKLDELEQIWLALQVVSGWAASGNEQALSFLRRCIWP